MLKKVVVSRRGETNEIFSNSCVGVGGLDDHRFRAETAENENEARAERRESQPQEDWLHRQGSGGWEDFRRAGVAQSGAVERESTGRTQRGNREGSAE